MAADEAAAAADDDLVHAPTSLCRCCRIAVPFMPSRGARGSRIASNCRRCVRRRSLLRVPARPAAQLLSQADVREEARRAGDEAGLVARVDEDSAAASSDDLGREVVGRDCGEERPPRTEVAEDLRGDREHSGLRLEQGEQDVPACQHVREDRVALEGKQAQVGDGSSSRRRRSQSAPRPSDTTTTSTSVFIENRRAICAMASGSCLRPSVPEYRTTRFPTKPCSRAQSFARGRSGSSSIGAQFSTT